MADKKALIIVAKSANFSGNGDGLAKLMKKGAVVSSFTTGCLCEEKAVAESDMVKLAPAEIAAAIEKGAAVMVCNLGDADTDALDAALVTIFDAIDRKTVVAVLGKDKAVFYGNSINGKAGTVARAASIKDVLPTLAYIADFPLTDACTGAIIYQVLKSPNLKLDEITKLKEALSRMEGALARDNREPWEKHDCA